MDQKNIAIQDKLIQLLKEFYSKRTINFKYTLTPHTVIDWGEIRLKSIGTDILQITNKAQRTKELLRFQKEMKDFGTFLLKKYQKLQSKKNNNFA